MRQRDSKGRFVKNGDKQTMKGGRRRDSRGRFI